MTNTRDCGSAVFTAQWRAAAMCVHAHMCMCMYGALRLGCTYIRYIGAARLEGGCRRTPRKKY